MQNDPTTSKATLEQAARVQRIKNAAAEKFLLGTAEQYDDHTSVFNTTDMVLGIGFVVVWCLVLCEVFDLLCRWFF